MAKRKRVKWACRNEHLSKIGHALLGVEISKRRKIIMLLPCPSTGKKSYIKKIAQKKAKRTTRDPIPQRAYKCPMCPNWHLTKNKKKRKIKKPKWMYYK